MTKYVFQTYYIIAENYAGKTKHGIKIIQGMYTKQYLKNSSDCEFFTSTKSNKFHRKTAACKLCVYDSTNSSLPVT